MVGKFKFTILILVLGVAACSPKKSQKSVVGVPIQNALATTKLATHLDKGDVAKALRAEFKTLQYGNSGVVETWQNTNTGSSGQIIAGQPYNIGDRDCRRYEHVVRTDGIEHKASGTACRNDNGRWVGLEPVV